VLNCARFRWASMQLQYLCSFKFDDDIKRSLGRLPPDLYTLYGDIYDVLSKTPGDRGAMVFQNVLRWLLCAQKRLETEEFLAVVSVDPSDTADSDPIAQEDVLEICNNFVVFDNQLNTFRFAHLSVREFLEQRVNILAANRLMAEICLWSVLSEEDKDATTDLLHQLGLRASPVSAPSDASQHSVQRPSTNPSGILYGYAVTHWATHCELAGIERESGALRLLLQHMLSHEPSFFGWNLQVLAFFDDRFCAFKVQAQLGDAMTFHTKELSIDFVDMETSTAIPYLRRKVRHKLRSPNVLRLTILAICCIFNLAEQVESVLGDQMPGELKPNELQQSLRLATKYGSCATIQQLLKIEPWTNVEISSEVIETAAGNYGNTKELITLFLNHPGGTAAISEGELRAAANNKVSGEAIMPLLHRRLRRDIAITLEGVEAAACNPAYGEHVMRFLLDQLEDVTITTSMVQAAVVNAQYSNSVLKLLFDRAGADILATIKIVKEAVGSEHIEKEVMLRLLDHLEADTPITLDVVKTAAGNKKIKKEVMLRLLDHLGADTPITLDVVETAAGNKKIKKEVMRCLLDRLEASATITAELTATVVQNCDADVVSIFLDHQRGANVQITEEIARVAAIWGKEGREKMDLLSKRLAQANTPITIGLTAAIVGHSSEDLIASFLDQRGADFPITEEVVMAAVNRPREEARKAMAILLERREQEMYEVLARLQDVRDTGRFEVLSARLARVKCVKGWIYLKKDSIRGPSVAS
jgi:hypothetical protein